MDSFIGIRFKKETAKRFQTFSRTYFKSHTEAMATMLDFFFYNEISPKEKLGPTGRTIEAKLLKRINAVIVDEPVKVNHVRRMKVSIAN